MELWEGDFYFSGSSSKEIGEENEEEPAFRTWRGIVIYIGLM
jgi:hypothetical protein